MDVALLSAAAQKSFNYFGMLAAKDYWFDSWIKRHLVNTVMNLIPIDRKVDGIRKFPIQDTLTLSKTFMDYQHRNLIFFPEGTRVPHGEVRPLQSGFAGLYKMLGLPVVPVAVNSGPVYHKRLKRPGRIIYRFGEPIPPGLPRPEIEKRVLAAINALNEEGL